MNIEPFKFYFSIWQSVFLMSMSFVIICIFLKKYILLT